MRKEIRGMCSVSVDSHTCCYPDYVKLYSQDDSPVRSDKQPVSLGNLKDLIKVDIVMNRKINHCGLGGRFEAETTCFHRGIKLLLPLGANTQVQNYVSLLFQSCEKDIPRTHYTIPWEMRSQEGVLWVLTVITLNWWNCSLGWLASKKWQNASVFQKT